MTNQQIANKLWDHGFTMRFHEDGILISLSTRKVSVMEIREALDFGVLEEACERWGDKVMVRGIDS